MSLNEFSSQPYPFQLAEAVQLYETLSSLIADAAQIDLLYKRGGGAELEQLNQAWSVRRLWKTALEELSLAGKLTQLLQILVEHPYEQVRVLANALLTAPPMAYRRVLPGDVLVLDRRNLREVIDLMANDASRCRVILVRGGPQTGKTHGRYLFEEVGYSRGAEVVYLAEGIVSTVDEVAQMLFGAYDVDALPPRDTTEEAWYRTICVELKKLASSHRRPLWIVADSLGDDTSGNPLLDPEIVRFLEHFAMLLSSPMIGRWFRLMLINYPDKAIPTKWAPELYREDNPSDLDIEVPDVEDGIREWLRSSGRTVHEQQLRKLAHSVMEMAELDDTGSCRLRRISSAFSIHVAALEGDST